IMSPLSLGTNVLSRAGAVFTALRATVGAKVVMDVPGHAVAYGRAYPEFWVGVPHDGGPATVGNGAHFSFAAATKEDVHAFYDKAIALGATDDGKPGPREHYSEAYYGCFVKDLDGNKIEAMFWDESKSTVHG
ncbi:MAG: VOC family protein, partial [Burkholderiaceae bacterium]